MTNLHSASSAPANAAWHIERRKNILRAHPEIKDLHGPHAASAFFIAGLVALQIGLSIAAAHVPWLAVLVSSYVIGAVVAHALGVLIHECAHNLVAHHAWSNKAWGIVANLGLLAPAAMEFRGQHLLHHQYLGEVDGRDTQAPSRAEVKLVGNSSWKKILSFTLGRFYYPSRPANKVEIDKWMIANWACVIAVDIAILYAGGVKSLVFLGVAGLAAFGPHPVGARRLSEHFPVHRNQPTHSYYGPWNAVSFFVGYHVEHHDFPAVPWVRLPKLHAIAHRDYDSLHAFRSWTSLLAHHFFDKRLNVGHYVGMGPVFYDRNLEQEKDAHHGDHSRG